MPSINRRDLIASLLGLTAVTTAGCSVSEATPVDGNLLSPDFETGHRLRNSSAPIESISEWRDVPVVIVGGGIAGLTAAWHLQRSGFDDFELLELEDEVGGTSRGGERNAFRFPWGAHYITTPMPENKGLIELLQEMGVVEAVTPDGIPVVAEQFLCREPEERVFADGQWHEGLFPVPGASQDDLDQVADFHAKMLEMSSSRDASGKRLFAIPIANSSEDPATRELDRLSMLEWMNQQGWNSARLRWYVDYACRDDYGLSIDQTSAWAGILYYAGRLRQASHDSQDVITWPSGNGFIVQYLRGKLEAHLRPRSLVYKIRPSENTGLNATCELMVFDVARNQWVGYRAKRVVFAAPQFIARHVIDQFRQGAAISEKPFQYSRWLVANVHLRNRPLSGEFPLCWDNVFYESQSLGYVVSTHQSGNDYGPTVWTWYYPFADSKTSYTREQLLTVPWSDWAELVLTDLERAHADIRSLVTRIDVMRWGHAMIQPYTGFVWSESRQVACKPDRNIHFANTDLSGVALFEEAFFHGVRAAQEVLMVIQERT